jgi:hypothetical protein
MNALAIVIDKRRRIEELWEKLRGAKTGTPEYTKIVNEIGVLAMEYHQLVDSEGKVTHSDSLRRDKIT